MNKLIKLMLVVSLCAVESCDFSREMHICKNYYLTRGDTENDVSLSYRDTEVDIFIDVVGPYVAETKYDDNYITVKQYPLSYQNIPDKSRSSYYIIPLKNKVNKFMDLNKLGPLNHIDFKIKMNELGMSSKLYL